MDGSKLLSTMLQRWLGTSRLLIFDIGARGGLHPRWSRFFPFIEVLGFEPDKAECEKLNKSIHSLPYSVRYLPYALGRENIQNLKFYVCRKPGCSSSYEPNSDFIRDFAFAPAMEVETIRTLDTTTLSEIAAKEQLQPDFMKIDVQGAELDVLAGGADIVARTKFIELEVEFNPQYRDQPLFHDVDRFMRDQGWSLLGLRRDYWRRKHGLDIDVDGCGGHLIHGDAIYYNQRVLDNVDIDDGELVKFLLILSAYRQNDFLLSLLRSPHRALTHVSKEDRALLERGLVRSPTTTIRLLRRVLRGINHRTKRRLIDALQDGDAVDWHDSDFF